MRKGLAKWFALGAVIFFLASGISASTFAYETFKEKNYLSFSFNFGRPQIVRSGGYLEISFPNCTYWYSPGDPKLPVFAYFIALPPYASLNSVKLKWEVKVGGRIFESGYKVCPAPPAITFSMGREVKIWGEGKEIWKGMDVKVYNSSSPFPKFPVRIASKGSLRGIKLIALDVFPVQYFPKEGKLVFYREVKVEISFQRGSGRGFFDEGSYQILQGMKGEIYNYEEALKWYLPLLTSEVEGYIIITTESDYSHLKKAILDLARARTEWGYQVYLLTQKRLYEYVETKNEMVPTNVVGYDPQEKLQGQNRTVAIRNWLKDHYKSLHILYVLLIGNPYPQDVLCHSDVYGDLPMLMAYSFPNTSYVGKSPYGEVPTDYFYACLKGTWDPDHNGIYLDKKELLDVSLYPQLFVGRIPFYGNYSVDEEILERLSQYHNYTSNRILAAMTILNYQSENGEKIPRTDGRKLPYYLGKALGNSWKIYALYEEKGLKPVPKTAAYYYGPVNTSNFIKLWNMGIGVEILSAHGYLESCWRKIWVKDLNGDGIPEKPEIEMKLLLSSYHVINFLKAEDCVVFHSSCLNAYPEDPHNMIFSMLQRSVGAIGGTREEIYCPGTWVPSNPPWDTNKIGYLTIIRLIKDKEPLGEALTLAKLGILKEITPSDASILISELIEITLYGDPALSPHKSAALRISSISQLKEYAVRGNGSAGNPYVIENLKISQPGCYYGIYVEGIHVHVIFENISLFGEEEVGIYTVDSSNLTFSGIKIEGPSISFELLNSKNVRLESSEIHVKEIGIIARGSNATLTDLSLIGWGIGIEVKDSTLSLREISMEGNGILFLPPGNLNLEKVTLNGREVLYFKGGDNYTVSGPVGEVIAYGVRGLKIRGARFSCSWIGLEMINCSGAKIYESYFSRMYYPLYVVYWSLFNASKDIFTSINGSCIYFTSTPSKSYIYSSYFSYFKYVLSAPSLGSFSLYSPKKIRYSYRGRMLTSYLGNYYYGKKGEDKNGDGIIDGKVYVPCEIGGKKVDVIAKYPLTYDLIKEVDRGMDFPPRILKVSPSSGYFKQEEIRVNAWISDEDLREVIIGGKVAKKEGSDEYYVELPLKEGRNVIEVEAVDSLGNWAVQRIILIGDRIPPKIHVIFPSNGTVLNVKQVKMLALVFDKYLNVSSIEFLVNGVPWNFTFHNYLLKAEISLREGKNELEIKAKDLAGNVAERSWIVYVDEIPPKVNITYPKNGQFFNYQQITVDWTASDNLGLKELLVSVNYVCRVEIMLSGRKSEGNLTLDLPVGTSTIGLEVIDEAGNENVTFVNVTVDKTPPSVEILWPQNGSWIRKKEVRVYADGSDNYGISKYVVEVNGKEVKEIKGEMGEFSFEVNLTQGRNCISITAYDLAGNYASAEVYVNVDYTPPQVKILSPKKVIWEKESEVTQISINWSGHDNFGIKEYLVYLNGQQVYKGKGNSIKLNLPPGKYSLEVKAIDLAGNVGIAKEEFEIKVDKIPPAISSFNISLPKYTNKTEGIVKWDVKDNESGVSYVEISVNGKLILRKGPPSGEIEVKLKEGKNEIKIEAFDKVGNSATRSIEIYVDTIPPKVFLKVNRQYCNRTSEIIVKISSRDNLALGTSYVYLDGRLYEKKNLGGNNGSYVISLKGLKQGWHIIKVVQFDKAGNFAEKEIKVCFDYTPPKILVTSPISWINTSQVEISWKCSDEYGIREVKVYFDGKEASDKAHGELTLKGVEGKNWIEILAEDDAGNWNKTYREFYIDLIPPKVKILNPGQNEVIKMGILGSSTEVSINWSGHDNFGIKEYLVYLNGQQVYKGKGNSIKLNLPPGKYSLEVKAIDLAGNVGIAKEEFEIARENVQYVEIAAGAIAAIFIIYEIFRRKILQRRSLCLFLSILNLTIPLNGT